MTAGDNVFSALFQPLSGLHGVGPRVEAALAKLLRPASDVPPRLIDLLWHFPNGFVDRRLRASVAWIEPGRITTLVVRVKKHKPVPASSRAPYKVVCEDETGEIDLVFFHGDRRFIERLLPEGEIRVLSGAAERFGERVQMAHPDHVLTEEQAERLPPLEPVYPAAAGLSQKLLRRLIGEALARVPEVEEWHDARLLRAEGWPDFRTALGLVHCPADDGDLQLAAKARKRLVFDELFASQLALAVLRRQFRRAGGRSIVGDGGVSGKIRAALPFTLTRSQEVALAEISADMAAPRRMLRLLQGDVGSGKTAVAVLACARALEAGAQAALMAPTEVLARQHFETVGAMAEAAGFTAALLTGREQGKTRRKILEGVASGETGILTGTHALFQADVEYKDLALAVIDEQHRFGVHQRFAMQAKGGAEGCDMLVMTATPIPRTLILTHYGEMDVSRLTEKPAGRKPILTRAVPLTRLEEVVAAIARARQDGAQVYWVCPLDRDLAENRSRRRRGARRPSAPVFRRCRGAGARTHEGRGEGRRRARLRRGEMSDPGGDDRHRGGRQRAQRHRHGHRARPALRPGAVASVARAGGARRGAVHLHSAVRAAAGRDRPSSGWTFCGRRTTGSRSRRRICGCAAAARVLGSRQSGDPGFRIARLPEDEAALKGAAEQTKWLLAKDADLTGTAQGRAAKGCLAVFEREEAARLIEAG